MKPLLRHSKDKKRALQKSRWYNKVPGFHQDRVVDAETDAALAALPTQEECAQLVAARIIIHYHFGAEVAMIKYHGVDHACFEHLISLMSEERQEQVHASELFSSATWAWSPGSSSNNSSRPSKRSTTLISPNVWETHCSARPAKHSANSLEIINDLPIGIPINNIISLTAQFVSENVAATVVVMGDVLKCIHAKQYNQSPVTLIMDAGPQVPHMWQTQSNKYAYMCNVCAYIYVRICIRMYTCLGL